MSYQEKAHPEFSSDESFDEEDENSSESDVDAKLVEDDVFDIEFFKCYSALKKKDEKIYDQNVKFFSEQTSSSGEEETQDNPQVGNNKKPTMSLLDHQFSLKEDEIEDTDLEKVPKYHLDKNVPKSFYEKELDEIKKSIEKISEDVDSDSDDGLLIAKGTDSRPSTSKSRKTIDALLDKIEEDEDITHLKQIWSDPDKLTEEDKFLRDYIINKRYIASNVADETIENKNKKGFFSENLDDLSDVDESSDENNTNRESDNYKHHSEEKDFDKIARVPRNATKTYRDLVEKREKKEKRLKRLEKEKKKKKALKDADFEDLVGDLPTKFHYRETEPNDYGLSAEELLMATDEELEQWVSLKDAIRYQDQEQELIQKKKFDERRNDMVLKKRIFKSIYGDDGLEGSDNQTDVTVGSKLNKRAERDKHVNNSSEIEKEPDETSSDVITEGRTNKRKKKHKRGLNHKKFLKSGVAPDRLLAYGLSKTKLKKNKLL